MPPFNQLSPAEQAEFHRCFPCAGWEEVAHTEPPPTQARAGKEYLTCDFWQFLGEATLTQPPNVLQFNHGTKCHCTSPVHTPGPSNSNTIPAIHLHLGDLPLTDQGGRCYLNLPSWCDTGHLSSDSEDGEDLIHFPSIKVLLRDLDQVIPAVAFMQYCAAFTGHGVFYVDSTQELSEELLINEVGMLVGVVKRFKNHTAHLARHAKKKKAQAGPIIDTLAIQKDAHQEKENVK
ncbi:hypothetical protein PAXRUDRAFT_28993 [Paxillus rubicundulus Ve08.2h10]|uniref:Uncharacterized protein n=1 Tax=Paxillus rubicundulus Ve08.2h10 TaxID=930991 RepID=A0A0D0CY93_9AGAM|nr:hypothetical protein PAXRUDRAFT_28993 [Paxillus rubicundulus Ve08.2h10]